MEEYSEFTDTELLCEVNDIVTKYEVLKKEVIDNTVVIDECEKTINTKIALITEMENKYIKIIEELENRKLLV